MKKLVSRFMAVLMAMTMILSMSMTAFAAEAPKGTLTVNNTVAGKTLDLYQIFTATKNEAGNVAYTLNSAYEGFFQSKISGASTLTGEALSEKAYNYVKDQVGTDGSNGAAFAKDILDWILKNATTVATTHTTANTTAGQIIWNVTAEPKFKNESIPPITTNTPPVSEEPSGDNSSRTPNVKTGDDTNVIMWLSLMGISLVIFSICKRKVHK